jgi:hypothetical protein
LKQPNRVESSFLFLEKIRGGFIMDALKSARKIVEDRKLLRDMRDLIDNYSEGIKDVVVIFVTEDWSADAYWQKLETCQVIKVLDALKKGMEEKLDIDFVENHKNNDFEILADDEMVLYEEELLLSELPDLAELEELEDLFEFTDEITIDKTIDDETKDFEI